VSLVLFYSLTELKRTQWVV